MLLLASDGSGNAVMAVSTITGASVCLPAAAAVVGSSDFLKDKERTEPIYLVLSLVMEGLGDDTTAANVDLLFLLLVVVSCCDFLETSIFLDADAAA